MSVTYKCRYCTDPMGLLAEAVAAQMKHQIWRTDCSGKIDPASAVLEELSVVLGWIKAIRCHDAFMAGDTEYAPNHDETRDVRALNLRLAALERDLAQLRQDHLAAKRFLVEDLEWLLANGRLNKRGKEHAELAIRQTRESIERQRQEWNLREE